MLYGSTPFHASIFNTLMYQVAYGTQGNKGHRTVVDGDTYIYNSDYDSKFAAFNLKLMGDYALSNALNAKPLVEASYRKYTTPDYIESAYNQTQSSADIDVNVNNSKQTQMILGVGEILEYQVDNQTNFITDLRVGYDFKHGDNDLTTIIADAPVALNGIDNGGVVYNLGFSYETIKEDGIFNLNYNLEGEGSSFQNHIFSAKYVFKF
jgi:hypothetical protein